MIGTTTAVGFASATLASAALTALWIALARRRQLVDLPGARRLHANPTPRGGGVGIAVVMAVAGFVAGPPLLGAGLLVFALAGLLDDLWSPPTAVKLALQVVAAALLTAVFAPVWQWAVPIVLAVVYVVNACNFIDGSNGMLAMQGLVLSTALALWPEQAAGLPLLAWCLAGACLGFLPFNLPRARTFLGDVGSHAIGASVAALMLFSVLWGSIPLPAALLMLTPILLDTALTLARRALARKPVWRAHREHLYQYAVRSGHDHLSVCLAYAAWTVASVLMALAGVKLRSSLVMWTLLILTWTVGAIAYCLLRRHWLGTRRQGVV